MRRALVIVGCLLALIALAAVQSQYLSGSLTVGGVIQDTNGVRYILDAPLTATNHVRSNGVWVPLPAGAGGISDAPSDSWHYGRVNGVWFRTDAFGFVLDHVADGSNYVRRNNAWTLADLYYTTNGHVHSGSDITTGTVAPSRLGTGVFESTNVLFADGIFGPMDWDWINGKPTVFPPDTHSHAWPDITGKPDVATNGHTHDASAIVSGTINPARIATGTFGTDKYMRGNGSGGLEMATLPTTPSPTNGIPDAPSDGSLYGRRDNAWVGTLVSDVDGLQDDLDSRVLYDDLADLSVGGLTITGSTTLLGLGSDITSGSGYKFLVHDSSGNVAKKVSTAFALSYLGAAAASHSHDWTNITGKPTEFPPETHGHDWSEITGEPDFVQESRSILTTNSLTGGGDLSANRTIQLVGDTNSVGNSKYYGTDSGGTRGFHALPSASGDVAFAVAAFWEPGNAGTPSGCTLISGSSSGVGEVYRSQDGLYKIGLSSAQPSGSFKRAVFAQMVDGYLAYSINVLSNATYRSTGTNVFVYVTAAGGTSNFETNNPVMLRLYNH